MCGVRGRSAAAQILVAYFGRKCGCYFRDGLVKLQQANRKYMEGNSSKPLLSSISALVIVCWEISVTTS